MSPAASANALAVHASTAAALSFTDFSCSRLDLRFFSNIDFCALRMSSCSARVSDSA